MRGFSTANTPRQLSSLSAAARLLAIASLLLAPAALAHAQTTSASGSSSQYSGVSNPPPNDTITADEEETQSAPAKPAPGTPASQQTYEQSYVPGAQPQAAPATAPAMAPAQPVAGMQTPVQPAASGSTASNAATDVNNPDYGIVTSTDDPAPAPQDTEDTGYSAHLVSRPQDPSYGIVDMVPSGPNELAEGTDIRVRLLTPLDTATTQEGTLFRAQVSQDVYKDGRVVIPVGSEMRGRVVQVSQGHRIGMHATLRLRPDDILLPDGTAYHLYAEAVGTNVPGIRTDDEGGIQAAPHIAKDLSEYGLGAGGVFGGPVGAGAGAIVGASMVTTHMLLQKPSQAILERGSGVVFSLTEPMALIATRN
jgi:hypothetical protein